MMSRAEWILGGMLVVLLVVVAALAIMLWVQPAESVPGEPSQRPAVVAPTPSYLGQTAFSASTAALREAQTWQADAALLKATATWPQGASIEMISEGASAWNFTYYSPGRQTSAIITVVDGQTSFLRENTVDDALSPLPATSWRVDSSTAVQTMLDKGGARFLRRERISTLVMNLTTINASNRVEWFVSLIGEQTGNSFTIRLDAATGEVIEIIEPA
ncbi:MAG: hypothetical protein GY803_30365 [Chloroflexi bacterium]|nr:hypothetical protein [Chloroflexota bacterium]